MTEPRITVTLETYGTHDDGPDVVRVGIDGQEVGAYCIADNAEAERDSMETMVRAVEKVGRENLRAKLLELADTWQNDPHDDGPDAWHVLNNCANDVRAALGEEEGSQG